MEFLCGSTISNQLTEGVDLDFVEFHLSYNDLELDAREFLPPHSEMGFAVHAPELFAHDHLLDLATDNPVYLQESIRQLTRVVELTRSLKKIFMNCARPVLVVNAGGWNRSGFLDPQQVQQKYRLLKSSLEQVNLNGVLPGNPNHASVSLAFWGPKPS